MTTPANKRATGPGQRQKLPDGSTLLFNFDIDGDFLKPEHKGFLEQEVVAVAKTKPEGLRVVIGGSADRLGASSHNVALSNRRIQAVAAFLKQRMPNYPWQFEGFGEGVGEDTATRAGDADDTRDDLFRSVIIAILQPGQPIPPKPNIPNVNPKKPGEVPRARRPPNPSACLTEEECPLSKSFSIQLVGGVTGGEGIEAAFLVFLIKDLTNKLEVLYSLAGVGLGPPHQLPVNIAVFGKPATFETKPTKVTTFGPVGGISSLTVPVGPGGTVPITFFSVLDFTFRLPGDIIPKGNVFIPSLDTGPISIPGAGIHGGRFKATNICRGRPGADRS